MHNQTGGRWKIERARAAGKNKKRLQRGDFTNLHLMKRLGGDYLNKDIYCTEIPAHWANNASYNSLRVTETILG